MIYIVKDENQCGVVFSKAMVKKYKKFHPNAEDCNADSFEFACEALGLVKDDDKVYAIKNGHVNGLFNSLSDYRLFTSGFSQPQAKKCSLLKAYNFVTGKKNKKAKLQDKNKKRMDECSAPLNVTSTFMDNNNQQCVCSSQNVNCNTNNNQNNSLELMARLLLSMTQNRQECNTTYIFTDGSYYDKHMGIGYYIRNNEKILSFVSFIDKPNASSTIAELIAVMLAVKRAESEGIKSFTIVHDYSAVYDILQRDSSVVTKKTPKFEQMYYEFMKDKMQTMQISFQKTTAHSRDVFNNYVDKTIHHNQIDEVLNLMFG